jgi:glycosyltransferase involved in cell wall biosynthesis
MNAGHVTNVVLMVWAWLLAVGWLRCGIAALRGMARVPDLTRVRLDELPEITAGDGPDLTVVVAACNEETAIEEMLRTLLAQTGLRMQIIAVDDRSTDRTGELMDRIADQDSRLKVIHNRALPEGWLGKPHALHLAIQQARGLWLLLTDGDVRFEPEALERALRMALREQADHLVLMPTMDGQNWAEAAMHATIQALSLHAFRMWRVPDPKSRDFFGVGGFTLVRRQKLEELGGMERLRMEVVEDVAIGYLVKRSGGRSVIAIGRGLVRIHWIEGFFGIVKNFEKNGFAGLRYRVGVALGLSLGIAGHALVPLDALRHGPWGVAAGMLSYLGIGLAFLACRRIHGVSPLLAFFFAPCALVEAWAFFRSTMLTILRGGVVWRGTFYPLADLRRNAIQWSWV